MSGRSLLALGAALWVLGGPAAAADASAAAAAADGVLAGWCADVAGRLRSVSSAACLASGMRAGSSQSVEGRALMVLDRPPAVAARSASIERATRPARILLIGGIHGDELTSVSVAFRWMGLLDGPQAATAHWRVVPLANPDGLARSPAQRTNARGVDLNRNFDTPDWSRKAMDYWVSRTERDPRRFPGQAPVSEPETEWLQQEIQGFRPDVIVSIHAPYGVLDFDGPAEEPKRFGRLRLNRLGVYPGSLGNYGGVYKGVPVITIELPNATRMPSEAEQRAIWNDMLKWIRENIVPAHLS